MPDLSRLFGNDRDDLKERIEPRCDQLRAALSRNARVSSEPSNCRIYARDLADLPRWLERALFRTTPQLVVQPFSVQDIARTLQFSNDERIPVSVRGIASSAYGGPVPTQGGIVIDLSLFQQIDSPNLADKSIRVGAGARFGDIEDALARLGLSLFTYPSNRLATIGGWIAGGGFGLNGFKYGHVAKYVAKLEIVTPEGEVRTVNDADADFKNYVGTEGLMGVIAHVTLRVRDQVKATVPHLLYFETDDQAFAFVQEMVTRGIQAASVEFYDASLMRLLNEQQRIERADSTSAQAPLLADKPSLLIFLDDAEADKGLAGLIASSSSHIEQAPRHVAGHLWADRFFPMKIRMMGPSLLASETILPLDRTAQFLRAARELMRHFGVQSATECHILATAEGVRALAMPMLLTDNRKASYAVHLALVSVLDRIASRYGGQPYNLGIWHASFAKERWGAARLAKLRRIKHAQDPRDLLSPGKFFGVRSRFAGIPGLVFHPGFFKLGMDVLAISSRLLAPFVRPTKSQTAPASRHDIARPQLELGFPAEYDLARLERTATECTSCGACVSVCPAYVHTKDERVTGRAKMWLARRLCHGESIAQDEADAAWLCVRCRACAEVCQAELPLMTAYEKLEAELKSKCNRPDKLIEEFVIGIERNVEYRTKVGLTLPVELIEQRWQKLSQPNGGNGGNSNHNTVPHPSPQATPVQGGQFSPNLTNEPDESFDLPQRGLAHGKYHIATKPALPRQTLLGKYAIDRNDQCISCGQCVEACIYGVHFRNASDLRRMNSPKDELCRACYRCIQECPRNALTISFDGDYAQTGRGAFTPDVISALQRQADEGRIPVLGAGYRGPFSGVALDSMWTDMSEIVRPTRDGIHGREYISTAVDMGRRPVRLQFDGEQQSPRFIEVPIPVLFNQLPFHRSHNVLLSVVRAAKELGTYAILARTDWFEGLAPYARNIALAVNRNEIDEFIGRFPFIEIDDVTLLERVKEYAPKSMVMLRTAPDDLEHIVRLVREGAEILHFAFDPVDQMPLFEQLPRIHARLVEEGLRDLVTLIASGAIAMAEHTPKTILLGADAVAIDLPLVVALECTLDDRCFAGDQCVRQIDGCDPEWGEQRIVNLIAAWRSQLLEVMGAMGMREVRRMRGERGRAMLKRDLDEKLFAPIFERSVTHG